MTRMYVVTLAIALFAFSGSRCPAAQGQATPSQTEQDSKPLLTLEPAAGPAGSKTTVKGAGFRGDCGVNLFFDGANGASAGFAHVDRSGAFLASIVIPADAAEGRHPVFAEGLRARGESCADPSGNRGEAIFVVTQHSTAAPSLMIDTIEARPGSDVHVSGRGFCAEDGCSPVRVLIDGQVGAENVKVSAGGTFSTAARVPAIKTVGRLPVVAVQTLADQSEIHAFGEIEVTPRPNVQRPQPR
jgi:hypothetical protein